MADAPDPLGKRALFWAPAQRHDGQPLVGSGRDGRRPKDQGKRALFSTADPAEAEDAGAARRPARRPARRIVFGRVQLRCGACGAECRVDVVESLLRSLPVPLVRPGRGFTHLMTCPACGQRTWLSASWRPWSC
jgi:hypothetical protein